MSDNILKPASLFADHMIVQRDRPIPVFGIAVPQAEVSVHFAGNTRIVAADSSGYWEVSLPPLTAGGPWTMQISSGDLAVSISDILVGDVWFCSGQSNMGLPMERLKYKYSEDYGNPENDSIRFFKIPENCNFKTEQTDCGGEWRQVNRDTIGGFSAACFYFSRNLQTELNIPVGMVDSSIGGTPIQSWMSAKALSSFPDDLAEAKRLASDDYLEGIINSEEARKTAWENQAAVNDKGYSSTPGWNEAAADFGEAQTAHIPGAFSSETGYEGAGVFWFSRDIELDAQDATAPAQLWFGRIIDADTVWVNGVEVGKTEYQYPPRIYDIAKGILKKGKNTITVRVVSPDSEGEFCAGKPYYLETATGRVRLEGAWKHRLGCKLDDLPEILRIMTKPMGPFNAMSAAPLKLPIKGMLWYQGESNLHRPAEYAALFAAMISDYRERQGNPELPVFIVQLPNYGLEKEMKDETGNLKSVWSEMRDAQRNAAGWNNCELVTAHDIGEWNDIHPLNKKDLGYRLAMAALNVCYGKDTPRCPVPVYCTKDRGKLRIRFEQTGKGLATRDGEKADGFTIAGKDGVFKHAKIEFEKNAVLLWSDEVPEPVTVRYAWADNPDTATITNSAGFPLPTFELGI